MCTTLTIKTRNRNTPDVPQVVLSNLLLPVEPASARESRKTFPKRQYTVELLIVGSNANNGSQCGLSYANSNNGFSNANDNIGARLNISTIKTKTEMQSTLRTGHTVAPVSMEGILPDRAKTKGIGYESRMAQQSPAVQVSKAFVSLCRTLGSRKV